MNTVLVGVIAALTLIVGLLSLYVRSYTSSYSAEKGKNLATQEDIQKVVEQVAAVTRTTKEIEAKISDDVWGRQRRWELKRDAIIGAMTISSTSVWASIELLKAREDSHRNTQITRATRLKASDAQATLAKILSAREDFNRVYGTLVIVCGDDVSKQFSEIDSFLRNVDFDVRTKQEFEDMWSHVNNALKLLDPLTTALRRELGFNNSPL